MNPEEEFARRIAAIHGLSTLNPGRHDPGERMRDIRHEEFQAMADVFLGEHFDREKLPHVERLQIALHEQQAELGQRYKAGKLEPEAYVEALNNLLDNTFAQCEDILGHEHFLAFFGAPRSALAGFIDKDSFLQAHHGETTTAVGPVNTREPLAAHKQMSQNSETEDYSFLIGGTMMLPYETTSTGIKVIARIYTGEPVSLIHPRKVKELEAQLRIKLPLNPPATLYRGERHPTCDLGFMFPGGRIFSTEHGFMIPSAWPFEREDVRLGSDITQQLLQHPLTFSSDGLMAIG